VRAARGYVRALVAVIQKYAAGTITPFPSPWGALGANPWDPWATSRPWGPAQGGPGGSHGFHCSRLRRSGGCDAAGGRHGRGTGGRGRRGHCRRLCGGIHRGRGRFSNIPGAPGRPLVHQETALRHHQLLLLQRQQQQQQLAAGMPGLGGGVCRGVHQGQGRGVRDRCRL